MVVERDTSRHDDAVIMDVLIGGGLPEHVHVQMEKRQRVGGVRQQGPEGAAPGRQGGDPGVGSVEQSSGQSPPRVLSCPGSDQSAEALPG